MTKDEFEVFKRAYISSHDISVEQYLGESKKLLVVFLRHLGCTYCRKTLKTFSEYFNSNRPVVFSPLFIHMSTKDDGSKILSKYNLDGKAHISDVDKELYDLFSIKQGSVLQLFGPSVLTSGVKDVFKYGLGKLKGDGFQMPALFVVDENGIQKSYRYKTIADEVDFKNFLESEDRS